MNMSNIAQSSATKQLYSSPKLIRDPSLPATLPASSKDGPNKENSKLKRNKLCNYLYNKDNKTFCKRTCQNWFNIIAYSITYIIFLATYTLIFLYGSLMILKYTTDYQNLDKVELLTYSENGIGLTAVPTSESSYPLIWYRSGQSEDYEKFVNALDRLLVRKRGKRDLDVLGPCGKSPYGYGESPCVVIRVNKQFHWAGKPLVANSSETKIAPLDVQRWVKQDKGLWLHCSGHHAYDKEHIGRIRYFPDPPGLDPNMFPLLKKDSPVIAIQVSNFTIGLSITIDCKLWYVGGPSTVNFMLYVAQDEKVSRRIS